jgi:rhomboid protease GluP
MSLFDILLWMAGASWLVLAVMGVRRARLGDRTTLYYLLMIGLIATPLAVLLPQALAAILGGLWLITLVIPGLLGRWQTRLMWQRRFHATVRLSHLIAFLQPIGPHRTIAIIQRYQALRESERSAEAQELAESFAQLPQLYQQQLRLYALSREQHWPELLQLLAEAQGLSAEGLLYRLRAHAEIGEIAGMLRDFHALNEFRESHPGLYRQALSIVLAFAGEGALMKPLLAQTAASSQSFWEATALAAAGDEHRAREKLERLRQPGQEGLNAAITWRLAHMPQAVTSWPAELRQVLPYVTDGLASTGYARQRPWLTWMIFAACVVMLIITESAPQSSLALWTYGAVDTDLGWSGNSWRFLAAAFLHVNVLHLGMNSLGLLSFGPDLERLFGRWRFALVYFGASLGGMGLVQALAFVYDQRSIVVGASASIMGLVGAELARILRTRTPGQAWWQDAQIRRMGMIVGLQVVFDLAHPAVSQASHIGGFLSGLFLAYIVLRAAPGR